MLTPSSGVSTGDPGAEDGILAARPGPNRSTVIIQILGEVGAAGAGADPLVTLSCTEALRATTRVIAGVLCLRGAGASLVLENLSLNVHHGILAAGSAVNGVLLDRGASATLKNCHVFSPDSPAIVASGRGTTVELSGCTFKNASAAVLAVSGGAVTARAGKITGARVTAFEVRGAGSTGACVDCAFTKCSKQVRTPVVEACWGQEYSS